MRQPVQGVTSAAWDENRLEFSLLRIEDTPMQSRHGYAPNEKVIHNDGKHQR
jgi:hypothetical protein